MTEEERQAFRAALDVAVRDRQELDQLIGYLSRRLGVPVPAADANASMPAPTVRTSPNADPSSLVADGEFFGMSATKATKAVLTKLGRTRPLKTPEIFEAISKGGVKLASEGVLYKSLDRSKDFIKVSRGTWGLTEWYPDRMRRPQRDAEPAEPGEIDPQEGSEVPADSIGVQT